MNFYALIELSKNKYTILYRAYPLTVTTGYQLNKNNANCTWIQRPWKRMWPESGNWMSPLIIEPDQLFICQITWEEERDPTEPHRTEVHLKWFCEIRNSFSPLLISIFLLSDWSVTWRGSNADGLGLWLGLGLRFGVVFGAQRRVLGWGCGCGRRFGKEINWPSAAGFLKPSLSAGGHAACHMIVMWHKQAGGTDGGRAGQAARQLQLNCLHICRQRKSLRTRSVHQSLCLP